MWYQQLRAIPIVSLYTAEQNESPEAIAEKTIELGKSVKSTTNEVVITINISRRDKLVDKGFKEMSVFENFCKEDGTIKFMRQKSLDSKKQIGKEGMQLNNFGITQIVKNFDEFLNNG